MSCGKCIYNKKGKDSHNNAVYFCGNEESEMYGEYVSYTDGCEEWDDFSDYEGVPGQFDNLTGSMNI